ncbi:acyl-CoA reductase [Amycolatopsis lurida]
MVYRYDDPFVHSLSEDIGRLILGESADHESIHSRQFELAAANSLVVSRYWKATELGRGIPDSAYKESPLYLFPDEVPAREFSTSGTSGGGRGRAAYSPAGLALMRLSITENARRSLVRDLDRPAFVRLVPAADAAPGMVMAYGMELIATTFGDPEFSDVVVGEHGIDYERLASALDAATAANIPVVLLGGSFSFVNACAELTRRGRGFTLPAGSKAVDAGGFKGRARTVRVADLRETIAEVFGIARDRFTNLFGMTELASQFYDRSDVPVGPLGERPKGSLPFAHLRVRDPDTMKPLDSGLGLLEVSDLCLIDRPPTLLTGDLAIAADSGAAVVGRARRGSGRGCSLTLDALTATGPAHA